MRRSKSVSACFRCASVRRAGRLFCVLVLQSRRKEHELSRLIERVVAAVTEPEIRLFEAAAP